MNDIKPADRPVFSVSLMRFRNNLSSDRHLPIDCLIDRGLEELAL